MKYRSKTVEVEAVQITDDLEVTIDRVSTLGAVIGFGTRSCRECRVYAPNLRGVAAQHGDWIIKDGDNFSVCSDDEFKKKYEAIEK